MYVYQVIPVPGPVGAIRFRLLETGESYAILVARLLPRYRSGELHPLTPLAVSTAMVPGNTFPDYPNGVRPFTNRTLHH